MVTPLDIGITLIEKNIQTQFWSHPDTIDLDNFVFGESYIHFYASEDASKMANNLNFESFPFGIQFALPLAEFTEVFPLVGYVTPNNRETANLIKQFFGFHREIGQETVYIIVKDGDDYEQFLSPAGGMKRNAPGWLRDLRVPYSAESREFLVNGVFQIVWR